MYLNNMGIKLIIICHGKAYLTGSPGMRFTVANFVNFKILNLN